MCSRSLCKEKIRRRDKRGLHTAVGGQAGRQAALALDTHTHTRIFPAPSPLAFTAEVRTSSASRASVSLRKKSTKGTHKNKQADKHTNMHSTNKQTNKPHVLLLLYTGFNFSWDGPCPPLLPPTTPSYKKYSHCIIVRVCLFCLYTGYEYYMLNSPIARLLSLVCCVCVQYVSIYVVFHVGWSIVSVAWVKGLRPLHTVVKKGPSRQGNIRRRSIPNCWPPTHYCCVIECARITSPHSLVVLYVHSKFYWTGLS